jgi:hypothetical protein
VLLLVTQPEERYLRKLGLSRADLFTVIQNEWTQYVKSLGATDAVTKPVDAVPVS